jgi:hypothetical protein
MDVDRPIRDEGDLAPVREDHVTTAVEGMTELRVDGGAEVARVIAQVQAAVASARRFPRDETAALARVTRACLRAKLAKDAFYAYPRGGETVIGPTVVLLRAVAQAWGNIDFGIREVHQGETESEMMAWAWDLETNTRESRYFNVPHKRVTKAKGTYQLTDPRDIYELLANLGARRMRACLESVIPDNVLEAAQSICRQTLERDEADVPLIDRLRPLVVAFAEFGVTQSMIERKLGHKIEETCADEFLGLRTIFKTIRAKEAPRERFFDFTEEVGRMGEAATLNERFMGREPGEDADVANA